VNCTEIRALLAFRPLDALDEEELSPVDEHLEACAPCRDEARSIEAAFDELRATEAAEPLPAAVWTGIVKGIEAPVEAPAPASTPAADVAISLSCPFCHDTLSRAEAVYCASCLAPHHGECWRQHGRCSAFGCEETQIVRPKGVPEIALAPRKRSRRIRYGAPLLFLVVGGGVAAYTVRLNQRRAAELEAISLEAGADYDRFRAEKELAEVEAARRREMQDQIDNLTARKNRTEDEKIELGRRFDNERRRYLDSEDAHRKEIRLLNRRHERELASRVTLANLAQRGETLKKALEPPNVTVHARDTNLADVIADVSSQTGKNFGVATDVHEILTLDLHDVPWRRAVAFLARTARCTVFEHAEGLCTIEQPPRVTIQFTDANVRTVLKLLASYAGKQISIDNDVKGDTCLDVHDIYWFEAIEMIAHASGLYVGREGNVIRVGTSPDGLGTPSLLDEGAKIWDLGAMLGEAPDVASVSSAAPALVRCRDCDVRILAPLLARCSGRGTSLTSEVRGLVTLDLPRVSFENALEQAIAYAGDFVATPEGTEGCVRIEPRGDVLPAALEPRGIRAAACFDDGPAKLSFDATGSIFDLDVVALIVEPGFSRAILRGQGSYFVVKVGDEIRLEPSSKWPPARIVRIDGTTIVVECDGKESALTFR
jgi:hypothetical protein